MALCLSWANLCYLRVWSELLTYTEADLFTMASEPARPHYGAALAGMAALGLAAWLVVRLARGLPPWCGRLVRWVPLAGLLVPLNGLRIVVSDQLPWLHGYLRQPVAGKVGVVGLAVGAGLLAAVTLGLLWRFPHAALRLPALTALISLPLLPVTTGQALWRAARSPAEAAAAATGSYQSEGRAESQHGVRLVLVIFDEWDYRLSFEARPAGLELAELDRWRRESLFATRALPPGEHTLTSVSALLTGKPVARVEPLDRRDAWLVPLASGPPVRWSAAPSIFQDAAEAGIRAGIAGWALPYCRLYGSYLTECAWWETSIRQISKGSGLRGILVAQLRSMVETAVFTPFGQSAVAQHHFWTWRAVMRTAAKLLSDPSLRFILIHLPVPHAPFFYDRRTGQFDRSGSLAAGYVDQLELVDRSVQEFRLVLERAGLWERTAVILTSDHSFRAAPALGLPPDRRVPFLVRLPGSACGIEYGYEFSTILTRQLAGAILRGALADGHQVALQLNRFRGRRSLASWIPLNP